MSNGSNTFVCSNNSLLRHDSSTEKDQRGECQTVPILKRKHVNMSGRGSPCRDAGLIPTIRPCLNSLQGAWERAEWKRGCSWSFVPFLSKNTCVWVHAESWASPVESVRTVCFAQATANWCPHQSSVVSWCPSTSNNKLLFPFGWAVRSSQTKKTGATLFLPFPRYIYCFFSGCTESIRFPQPISTNSCCKIVLRSVRSNALWAGLRHAPSMRAVDSFRRLSGQTGR